MAELSGKRGKDGPAPASLDLAGRDVSLSEGRGMQAAVEMQRSWARVGASDVAGEPSLADTLGERTFAWLFSPSPPIIHRGERSPNPSSAEAPCDAHLVYFPIILQMKG